MKKIAIIGSGPSGMFSALKLSENKELEIDIFEKGKDIRNRKCPLMAGKTDKCLSCKSCDVVSGVAGAGAYADGKYIISTEYGGWLPDFYDDKTVLEYIEKADEILIGYGATKERYKPNDDLKKKLLQHDLHMQQANVKHLGTDKNFEIMCKMRDDLVSRDNVTIHDETTVADVTKTKWETYCVTYSLKYGDVVSGEYDYVIFAVGRSGNGFFKTWCDKHDVKTSNNQVDIGVRVEQPNLIWKDFTDQVYEAKILYKTQQYGDIVRTFCQNYGGEVVVERNEEILSVNGHSYASKDKLTENTNYSLLSTIHFTEPFNQPVEYAHRIVSLANAITNGSVIVQTLGDLEKGRRSTEKRIKQNMVKPTLKTAVPGDLSLCMPKRQLDDIIETLHALDKCIPGVANPDTLLYGVEAKYYSCRPETTKEFELLDFPNVYAIGDGAGFTRSLSQASAQGLMVADFILSK